MRFEIVTVVVMKIRILLNVTFCWLVNVNTALHPSRLAHVFNWAQQPDTYTDRVCACEFGLDFQTGEGHLLFPLCPEWCKDGTTFELPSSSVVTGVLHWGCKGNNLPASRAEVYSACCSIWICVVVDQQNRRENYLFICHRPAWYTTKGCGTCHIDIMQYKYNYIHSVTIFMQEYYVMIIIYGRIMLKC